MGENKTRQEDIPIIYIVAISTPFPHFPGKLKAFAQSASESKVLDFADAMAVGN